MTVYSVRCNHCGDPFMCPIDRAAFPCCPSCYGQGHRHSPDGGGVCRRQLEEDLRSEAPAGSDALDRASANAKLDIGWFDD